MDDLQNEILDLQSTTFEIEEISDLGRMPLAGAPAHAPARPAAPAAHHPVAPPAPARAAENRLRCENAVGGKTLWGRTRWPSTSATCTGRTGQDTGDPIARSCAPQPGMTFLSSPRFLRTPGAAPAISDQDGGVFSWDWHPVCPRHCSPLRATSFLPSGIDKLPTRGAPAPASPALNPPRSTTARPCASQPACWPDRQCPERRCRRPCHDPDWCAHRASPPSG